MRSSLSLGTIVAAGTTIFFWGSAFAGIRAGLQGYSPAHLAVLRFLVASLVLGLVAVVTRMRRPERRDLPRIFLLGLVGFAFYNLALNTGEQSIAAGPAALLIQTTPIWTALLAVLLLGERLRGWGWGGIALSFGGALVIAAGRSQGLGQFSWGAVLILLAALSTSTYNIVQKQMLARYRPVEITSYALWAGTLLLLPFACGLPAAIAAAPWPSTLAVIYLGIAPAALGYVTWAMVLAALPAARAASILYVVPVMAFLVAWLWLGEKPQTFDIVGGLLAIAGVVIVNTLGRARAGAATHVRPAPGPAVQGPRAAPGSAPAGSGKVMRDE